MDDGLVEEDHHLTFSGYDNAGKSGSNGFQRPTTNLVERSRFSEREVGVTHPDLASFIKINDEGDIMLVVSDSLAIILHKESNSIVLVADEIKMLTKPGDAIRINNSRLNSRAFDFTQPALIPITTEDVAGLYDDALPTEDS